MKTVKNKETLTVILNNNEVIIFPSSFSLYKNVMKAIEENDEKTIKLLSDYSKEIYKGNIVINDSTFKIGELELHEDVVKDNKLFQFIKQLKEAGLTDSHIERVKPFIKNMFDNPFIDAVEELFDYCCVHDFVITKDGCFLAYKNVDKNYNSIHASPDGTHLNHSIGSIVKEKYYDTDRTQTCSKGLHFCSKGYLKYYPGDRTVIVKVNPKDVVSIPIDYSFMKGRCREYKVIAELKDNTSLKDYY